MTWMPSARAPGRVEPGDRRAVEHHDGAALGLVHSADELDQCTLAATVLAREAQHFARQDLEPDVPQGFDAAEGLREVLELEEGLVRIGHGNDAFLTAKPHLLSCVPLRFSRATLVPEPARRGRVEGRAGGTSGRRPCVLRHGPFRPRLSMRVGEGLNSDKQVS